MAVASDETSIMAVMNTRDVMAILTPESATSRACRSKRSFSVSGFPNSCTSSAPETEKRSVMVPVISACCCRRSLVSPASRLPTALAGTMKTGSRIRAASVSCQDSATIATTTSTRVDTLLTAEERVEVNACWAPDTSFWSRDTSLPVLEREKNATDIRCTWSNSWVRRCRISPSPMRAEHHRSTTLRAALNTAMPATTSARMTIRLTSSPSTPSSMMRRNNRAGATPRAEPSTTVMRNTMMRPLNGAP